MNQARVVLLRHLVASRAQVSHVNREPTSLASCVSSSRSSPRSYAGRRASSLGAQPKSFRVETLV